MDCGGTHWMPEHDELRGHPADAPVRILPGQPAMSRRLEVDRDAAGPARRPRTASCWRRLRLLKRGRDARRAVAGSRSADPRSGASPWDEPGEYGTPPPRPRAAGGDVTSRRPVRHALSRLGVSSVYLLTRDRRGTDLSSWIGDAYAVPPSTRQKSLGIRLSVRARWCPLASCRIPKP